MGLLSPNALFGSSGIDKDAPFQFQGYASLFSEPSTPERTALLRPEGKIALRSIILSAPLEGPNRTIHDKPGFIFGDVAPDPEHKLATGDERWIFTVGEDKFYIPSNARHHSLSYFFLCHFREEDALASNTRTRVYDCREIHLSRSELGGPSYLCHRTLSWLDKQGNASGRDATHGHHFYQLLRHSKRELSCF